MKDGGQAFPQTHWRSPDGMIAYNSQDGMSLRDWFAGQALSAANSTWSDDVTRGEFARRAYQMADAMLAERVKEVS